MNREELIKALKDWKPELELLAKYNDNSIDYQRYRVIDETIKTLEQIPDLKEAYNKGYKDGQEALAVHMELCEEEAEPCREADDYENEIADLQNRLDIAEYDKERYKEEIAALEAENKTLRIELENAVDVLKGLKADLEDARAELRKRW